MRTQRYWQLIGPRGRVSAPALIAVCAAPSPSMSFTCGEAGTVASSSSFSNSTILPTSSSEGSSSSSALPLACLAGSSRHGGTAPFLSSSLDHSGAWLVGGVTGNLSACTRRYVASGAVPPPPPKPSGSSSSFGRFAMPPPPSPPSASSGLSASSSTAAAPPPMPPFAPSGSTAASTSRALKPPRGTSTFGSGVAAPLPPPPPAAPSAAAAAPTAGGSSASLPAHSSDHANPPAAASSSPQQHARPGSVKVILPRPAAQTVEALAWTQCPQCGERSHVKHLLQHVNQAHPEIDRDHLRRQVREQYTSLSAAVKTCWADQAAACGSTADKNRGGVPCRHCPIDATGLPPLFSTVDVLMRHIGHRHKEVDLDNEDPPQRMSPDMVMKKLDGTLNPPAATAPKVGATGLDGVVGATLLSPEGSAANNLSSDPSRTGAVSLPFPCEVCGRNYNDEVSILQHLEEKHPEVVMHPDSAICFSDALVPPALCLDTATRIIAQVASGNFSGTVPAALSSGGGVGATAGVEGGSGNEGDDATTTDVWAVPTMAPAVSPVKVGGVPVGASPHQIAAATAAANYSGTALGSIAANGIPPPPPGSSLTGGMNAANTTASLSGPPGCSTTGAAISVVCALCPGSKKVFTTEVALLAHVKTKHAGVNTVEAVRKMIEENEVRALKCPHCERVFTSDSALDAHVKGKHQQTLTSDGTTMSLSISTGNIAVGGSGATTSTTAANSDAANSWWCNACNKGFSTGRALHGHLMTKHGLQTQSLPCPACRRTFTDIFSLKEHVTLSHRNLDAAVYESEMYPCDACGKRFLSSTELDTHTILAHVGHRGSAMPGGARRSSGSSARKPLFGQTF